MKLRNKLPQCHTTIQNKIRCHSQSCCNKIRTKRWQSCKPFWSMCIAILKPFLNLFSQESFNWVAPCPSARGVRTEIWTLTLYACIRLNNTRIYNSQCVYCDSRFWELYVPYFAHARQILFIYQVTKCQWCHSGQVRWDVKICIKRETEDQLGQRKTGDNNSDFDFDRSWNSLLDLGATTRHLRPLIYWFIPPVNGCKITHIK